MTSDFQRNTGARKITGFVERVDRRIIEGWIQSDEPITVTLVVDGQSRATQEPELYRADAVSAGYPGARGWRFYTAALALRGGAHVVEIVPCRDGQAGSRLPGVGVERVSFDLDLPDASHDEPGVIEHLKDYHSNRPEIRRLLMTDHRIHYRPDTWVGDVLFVDGLPGSHSTRYRIHNIQTELTRLGYDCCTLTEDELWRVSNAKYSAKIIHFFRTPLVGIFATAATAARDHGARIGYDIDDLAFDPAVMPYIDGLRGLSEANLNQYRIGMLQYRAFIEYADFITTTTGFLADKLRSVNKNTSVVVNSIGREFIGRHFTISPRDDVAIRIGYYSGTATHQADFASAASALAGILAQFPGIRLRVVGNLDLSEFPRLIGYGDRVERSPVKPYGEMLRDMEACDIIIAPLEIGNPYCEAKSELKYFEAGLTGAAVVASPTAPFAEAIRHGVNGLLANTTAEWLDAISSLIRDPDGLRAISTAARKDALSRYAAPVAAERFLAASRLIEPEISTRAAPPLPSMTPPSTFSSAPPRLSIGFVLPPPAIGAGGYRKILRICYDLEQAGHHVVLYVLGGLTPAVVADVIRRNYYPITSRVFRYNGTVAHHQFLVATSWETAYVVRKHAGTADHCVYFVQDFEPLFNPIGSAYLKALATYMFGFQTICLGHWVGDRLKRELNLSPRIIPFPLDHATYNCAMPATARGKSILLYARPSQERRAFALATEALERVACRAPEVSIGLYGESDYPEQRFAFQNHGLFTDEVQLAKLYRNTTVGVCLSPTNPSLVGYEMMACGTSLVDLDIPGVEANYGGRDAVFLAMPTADDLAGQMLLALHDDRLREGRIERGLRLTSGMQSDESMAVAFQKYLLEFAQLDHVVIPDTGGNGADTPTLAASPARTSAGRGGRKHRATRAAAIATKTDPILVPST